MSTDRLPRPGPGFLKGASLFLDFDGTLVELQDRPDMVIADDRLRGVLKRLRTRLDGRLAIVSGRSLAQIDAMLGPVAGTIGVSGSHGAEQRWDGIAKRPDRPAALDIIADRLHSFVTGRHGVLVEEKSFGVGLHYRMAPAVEADAHALASDLATTFGMAVQHGKMMVELRLPGTDKGSAIKRLMEQSPFDSGRPVFVGDDVTDEDGFVAVRDLGGDAVLVGDRSPSAATHALPDPGAVLDWLEETCP